MSSKKSQILLTSSSNEPSALVRGARSSRADAPQVELGPDVQRAVIAENVFTGAERTADHGAKSVQIGLNAATA